MADANEVAIEHQLVVRSLMGQAFGGASAARLAGLSREQFFPSGTVIYRAGDPARFVYFILDGRVDLTVEGRDPWTFTDRGVFGILDAELERPHVRTARALSDVRVIALRAEDWQDLVEDTFDFTRRRISRNTADLLRRGLAIRPHAGFEQTKEAYRAEERLAPNATRDAADPFARLLVLHLTDLFERAGIQSLIRLARGAVERDLTPGETIAEEGEPAAALLVVADGSVTISRREPAISAVFGAGRVVGGYAGLGHERWPVTARAREPSRVLAIRYEELFDVMEDHFDLVRSVMAFLAAERERLQTIVW